MTWNNVEASFFQSLITRKIGKSQYREQYKYLHIGKASSETLPASITSYVVVTTLLIVLYLTSASVTDASKHSFSISLDH